jgi:hypothetical protein
MRGGQFTKTFPKSNTPTRNNVRWPSAGDKTMSDLNAELTQIADLATNIEAFTAKATDMQLLETGARALTLHRYFESRFGTATTLEQLFKIAVDCQAEFERRERNALRREDARRCLAAR